MRPGAQRARLGKNLSQADRAERASLPGVLAAIPRIGAYGRGDRGDRPANRSLRPRRPWRSARESEPTAAATVAIGPHIFTLGRFGTIGRPCSAETAGTPP